MAYTLSNNDDVGWVMLAEQENRFSKDFYDVEHAFGAFGIYFSEFSHTNPTIMANILLELKLDFNQFDQSLEWVKLLKRLITEPIPLAPLKERIILGILQNSPLHRALLEISEHQNHSFKMKLENAKREQLTYGIYFIIILETLTYLMVSNREIETILAKKIFESRGSVNYGSTFWNFMNKFRETNDVFLSLKTVSVDPFMFENMSFRQHPPFPTDRELTDFIKQYHLTGMNGFALKTFQRRSCKPKEKHRQKSLYGNILEAVTNEEMIVHHQTLMSSFFRKKLAHQSVDNVKAGVGLLKYLEQYQDLHPAFTYKKTIFKFKSACQLPPASQSTFWDDLYAQNDSNNYLKTSTISSDAFVNTYEAWNLAFVMRKFPTGFYLYVPKLITPSTLCSVPEYYAASRVISLWLTMNFSSALSQKDKDLIIETDYADFEYVLTVLGKHTLRYAKEVLLENKTNVEQSYDEQIQSRLPIRNYIEALRCIFE